MPINRLIRDGEIEAQEVERLNRAFTFTLRSLGLVDRDDPLCEMVARKMIELTRLALTIPLKSSGLPQQSSASKSKAA
jgi:hypothetical protein